MSHKDEQESKSNIIDFKQDENRKNKSRRKVYEEPESDLSGQDEVSQAEEQFHLHLQREMKLVKVNCRIHYELGVMTDKCRMQEEMLSAERVRHQERELELMNKNSKLEEEIIFLKHDLAVQKNRYRKLDMKRMEEGIKLMNYNMALNKKLKKMTKKKRCLAQIQANLNDIFMRK